jgi:ABC-type dipeptide/oligopeptide/nickel transport system permease subunit
MDTTPSGKGTIIARQDILWLGIWIGGLLLLGIWDAFFLNPPAFLLVRTAFANTLLACSLVLLLSLLLGWSTGILLHFLETRHRSLYLVTTFCLNFLRSIPQIVGALIGYVILTFFLVHDLSQSQISQLAWMAFVIALFVFQEVADLVRERIAHYSRLEFFHAMLSCGISEGRIVNREILWKNSRAHMLNKLVSIFAMAMFLQCSIDFIVSVGLSTDVSLSNFPVTLGSLLAKLDSKQDILAVGTVLRDVTAFPSLLFEHLQGISTASIIVFTLFCMYRISHGLVKHYRL